MELNEPRHALRVLQRRLLLVVEEEPKLVLDKLEHDVLKTIRTTPHSVRLEDLARSLGLAPSQASRIIQKLGNKGLIRQHSRDNVPPSK